MINYVLTILFYFTGTFMCMIESIIFPLQVHLCSYRLASVLHCVYIVSYKCDWIWENLASINNYKYLEILIFRSIVIQEQRQVCA